MPDLHLAYCLTSTLDDALRAWDRLVVDEPAPQLHRWTTVAVWPAARSATVAASTAIEGNRLTSEQVDEVLGGSSVAGAPADVRDVLNYNRALDLANRAALRADFEWSQELIRRLNSTIIDGLEDDERGEYRRAPVFVGGAYEPPDHRWVPGLMRELEAWLRLESREHLLVRAGLADLNLVSIHPWLNGNGRTSRLVGSLALMRGGIAAPELVNVESVIRADPAAYVDALQSSHGSTYRPDQHSATPWLEYFAAVAVDRLELRSRLYAALANDFGTLVLELEGARQPLDWAPLLLSARVLPVRASQAAAGLELSGSRTRAMLAGAVAAGWLVAVGETRGRRYIPAARLAAIPLRAPDVLERLRRGTPMDRD